MCAVASRATAASDSPAGRRAVGEQHDARNVPAASSLRAASSAGFEVGAGRSTVRRSARSPRVGVGQLTQRRGVVHRAQRVGPEGDDAEVMRDGGRRSIRRCAPRQPRSRVLADAVRHVHRIDDRLARGAGRHHRTRERGRQRDEQSATAALACSRRCRRLKFVRATASAQPHERHRREQPQRGGCGPGQLGSHRPHHTVILRSHVHHSASAAANASNREIHPPGRPDRPAVTATRLIAAGSTSSAPDSRRRDRRR